MVNDSLPDLITLNNYTGDWFTYLEAIYQHYLDEIVNGKLLYNKIPIRCQFRPAYEGKGFAFWHAISEGEKEDDRKADLRRCERIRWIPWVIRNSPNKNNGITYWENKRGSNSHTVLFLEEESYVVILAKRKEYYLFKTAYCANPKRKKQLMREREEYWKSKRLKAPVRTPSDAPSTHGR